MKELTLVQQSTVVVACELQNDKGVRLSINLISFYASEWRSYIFVVSKISWSKRFIVYGLVRMLMAMLCYAAILLRLIYQRQNKVGKIHIHKTLSKSGSVAYLVPPQIIVQTRL